MSTEAAPEDVPSLGWMPAIVCHDIHLLEHDERRFWLEIRVTSQLHGEEPHGPLPVRADLGRRIADLVRADVAEAGASDAA